MYLGIIVLWIILNGRITGEILIFGIMISVAVSLFSIHVMGYSMKSDERFLRNLPLFIGYIFVLIWEIIKAAVAVALLSLGRTKPDPQILEFHSGLTSDLQNVMLANSITLTPGTITVFQEGDRFVVHCLRKEYGEGLEDCIFIRMLRKFK